MNVPNPPSNDRTRWIIAPGDPTCIFRPGIAKPIKCGCQKAAALIVEAVNAHCRACKGTRWIKTGTPGERVTCDCTDPAAAFDRLWEIHKLATQSHVLPQDVEAIARLSEGFAPAPAIAGHCPAMDNLPCRFATKTTERMTKGLCIYCGSPKPGHKP